MTTVPEEFTAGTPVVITVKFYDETATPPALTDPGAATLVIQPGFGVAPLTLPLTSLTRLSVGTFTYTYATAGVATTEPVEHTIQCQATAGISGISDTLSFVVKPPSVPGLT